MSGLLAVGLARLWVTVTFDLTAWGIAALRSGPPTTPRRGGPVGMSGS
jgi:hypothetical protein